MRIDVIAPPGTAFRPAATAALSGGALLTDRGRQVTLSAPGSETEARLGPHWEVPPSELMAIAGTRPPTPCWRPATSGSPSESSPRATE
jgi:hypothetical protein